MTSIKNMLLQHQIPRCHGSITLAPRISSHWFPTPAAAIASNKDAKLLRITRYRYNNIPVDSNGKYYYIKDGDTVWNPGAMPTRTPLDVYECRHGLGYSRFHGEKNGLAADLLAFVPVDTACEINKLTLRNNSDKAKEISLFSYVEFCLWNAVDDMSN